MRATTWPWFEGCGGNERGSREPAQRAREGRRRPRATRAYRQLLFDVLCEVLFAVDHAGDVDRLCGDALARLRADSAAGEEMKMVRRTRALMSQAQQQPAARR